MRVKPCIIVSPGRAGTEVLLSSLAAVYPRISREVLWLLDDCPVEHKMDVLESYKDFTLFKVLYTQAEEPTICKFITDNFRVIHLTRNMLHREISIMVAESTNVWHRTKKVKPDPIIVDTKELIDRLWFHQTQRNLWSQLADIEYNYEQMIVDWDLFVDSIVKFVGLEPKKVVPTFVKNFDWSPNIIANIEEVREALSGSKFEPLTRHLL